MISRLRYQFRRSGRRRCRRRPTSFNSGSVRPAFERKALPDNPRPYPGGPMEPITATFSVTEEPDLVAPVAPHEAPAANTRRPRSSSFEPTASQRLRIAWQSIMPIRISPHRSAGNPAAPTHIATCRLTQNRLICSGGYPKHVRLTVEPGWGSHSREGSAPPLQQGRAGRGPSGLRGHRGVRGRAMAGRTGACAQAPISKLHLSGADR